MIRLASVVPYLSLAVSGATAISVLAPASYASNYLLRQVGPNLTAQSLIQDDGSGIGLENAPSSFTVFGETTDLWTKKFQVMATTSPDGYGSGYCVKGDFGSGCFTHANSGYDPAFPYGAEKAVSLVTDSGLTLGDLNNSTWSFVFGGAGLGSMDGAAQRFTWGTTRMTQSDFFATYVRTERGSAITCNSTNAGVLYYRTVGTGVTQRSGICVLWCWCFCGLQLHRHQHPKRVCCGRLLNEV